MAYIDTENNFRPERILDIAPRFGIEGEQLSSVLDNVSVLRAFNSEHQIAVLNLLPAVFAQAHSDGTDYKLLIVDSATALFRLDYQGRGELADRQQQLGQYLSKLTKISEEFDCAVLITNQVTADPGANAMFVQDPKKV